MAGAPPRIVGRRVLSDAFFRLEQVTIEHAKRDGTRQALEREVYHNGPGAAVLPVDTGRGTVLLVRQLRVPALVNGDPPLLLEACAGIIDGAETPEATVMREAQEELGVRVHDLRRIATVYPSPGASAEKVVLFVAAYSGADRTGQGGGLEDEGEDIGVVEMTLARASTLARDGLIVDAKTLMLITAARDAG